MPNEVTATLICGHRTVIDVRALFDNERLDCFACKEPRQWTTFLAMWQGHNFTCTQCRYARSYGKARIMCDRAADKHARKMNHTVLVRVDSTVTRTIHSTQRTLHALQDALPPF